MPNQRIMINIQTQPRSAIYLQDCIEGMKQYPDKHFDLAIVDPPYGIGVNHNIGRRKGDKPSNYKPAVWDNKPPTPEYFSELFRVSKNQIVWGANHFISLMPKDSPCWIGWDKKFSDTITFAQFELAWTSFNTTCKKFECTSIQQHRIHPTQKPVALYEWLLHNYAKAGDLILDTHLGSGSSRIAAYKNGFDFVGFEIDADYYAAQEKRFQIFISQQRLF